ncbi:LysM peptidoglycan-binding domain-containing protein [Ornithinicoccus halotolerans]|uniref:LysM peptidoglycan-binding domain-containing protein n=1 Tax=Ornithinicoccus halotolerans TaxID=1748220 RepID=UPI0012948B88|nr:transglycosylase family protein [Ornithinicoccus halotolerans]
MKYTPKHAAAPMRRRRLAGAALTGAASLVAMGMAAPAAQASSVWDRLAECESSGNWSINTGNGFYGGLQFAHSTWVGYGGQEYAQYAHQASRAQQIDIAQRVLEGQGPGAWPVCSVEAGLTASNGGSSDGASGGAAASTETETESTETETQSEPEPQPEPETSTEAPAQSAPAPTQSAPQPQAAGQQVTVRPGETVAGIAQQHGVTVQAIVEANGLADADFVVAGWTLVIPQSSEVHTIQPGDTVAELAQEHGVAVRDIVTANGLNDADFIVVGEQLQIPAN